MDVVAALGLGTLLGLGIGVVTGLVLSRVLSDIGLLFLFGVETYTAIAFMVWVFVMRRRNVSLDELGFRRVTPGVIFLMVPATAFALYMNGVVARMTSLVFGEVPTAREQLAVGGRISTVDLVLLLVLTAVVAPLVEELIFRGLLYRVVRARRGIALAAAISALAFALVHFIPLLVGVFFVFGLILAAVAQRYESLYPAIVLHSLNNAVVVALLYAAA